MARYGLPWQGSKSRIAEWVIDVLPPSHTLVDLFAGGGAITHCALLSGKWQHIIMNDKTDSASVFMDAIRGDYTGFATVPTREEFLASEDTITKVLYSFGNDRTTYAWSDELASVKVPACKMLTAPSLHERRMAYMEFCRSLGAYLASNGASTLNPETVNGLQRLQPLEHLDGVCNMQNLAKTLYPHGTSELEALQALERVQALERDYRLVDIPVGATVYADPPYRNTPNSSRYGSFDFDAFDQWLAGVDFPVFVSEYDAPTGCVEIAQTERTGSMAANATKTYTERIFVQERFYEQCRPKSLFDFAAGEDA